MKRLAISLLILAFLAAVAIAPILIGEKGYILIAMGDVTIESTVVTASIMLGLSFITLLLILKLLRGGIKLSFFTWHKIAFAGQRRGLRNLNKGIAAYVLADYPKAEQLLAKAAEPSSFEHIAYLVAADAAQKQALKPNTEHYLKLLDNCENTLKEAGLDAIIIKVKLLIGQQNYQQAREVIDLHHKHIGHDFRLLALEIDLALIEKRFDYVIGQLDAAKKNKALDANKLKQWQQQAFYGAFNQQITQHDQATLEQYWQQLSRKNKHTETVILCYCQVLAEQKIKQPLEKLLLPAIKKANNSDFIKAIRSLPIQQADNLLAAAQKHLHAEPHSPLWLSLVAHLAANNQQWQLAEKAFNSLVNLEGEQYDKLDLIKFAQVLEQQQHLEKANQVLKKLCQL